MNEYGVLNTTVNSFSKDLSMLLLAIVIIGLGYLIYKLGGSLIEMLKSFLNKISDSTDKLTIGFEKYIELQQKFNEEMAKQTQDLRYRVTRLEDENLK